MAFAILVERLVEVVLQVAGKVTPAIAPQAFRCFFVAPAARCIGKVAVDDVVDLIFTALEGIWRLARQHNHKQQRRNGETLIT